MAASTRPILLTSWLPLGAGLLLLALLLRLGYAWAFQDHWAGSDAVYYLHDARLWLEGQTYPPYWPPGLPALLAGISCLSGLSLPRSGLLLMLACSWGLLYALYHLLPPRPAHRRWLIVFAFCLYPAFVHHGAIPLTQLPAALLLLLIAGLAQRVLASKVAGWPALLTGLCGALLVLIRPSSLLAFGLLVIFLSGQFLRTRQLKAGLQKGLLLGLLPLLLIGGWQWRVMHMTGRWIWINEANGLNLFIGNNPDTPLYKTWWLGSHDESGNPRFQAYYQLRAEVLRQPEPERGAAWPRLALQHIRQRPDLFLLRTVNRIRCFWAFDTYAAGSWWPHHRGLAALLLILDAVVYVCLMVLALRSLFRPLDVQDSMLLLLIGAYAFPYFVAFSHPNYHLPVMPLLALFAARGGSPFFTPRAQDGWRAFFRQPPVGFWWALALFGLIQLEWIVLRMLQIT